MKPIKVLHALPSLQQSYGGPLRTTLDLSAMAAAHGVESEVVGVGQVNVPDNPLRSEAIHPVVSDSGGAFGYSAQLRTWLQKNVSKYDGVVIHGMWTYSNWAVHEACMSATVPYVYFPHGMLEPWPVFGQGQWKALKKSLYWRWREGKVFSRACAAFYTTKTEATRAQDTLSQLGAEATQIPAFVVPYGVASSTARIENTANTALQFPPDAKLALFLGRLHPKKNVDLLVKAWSEARPSSEWRLVLAGPGEPECVASLKKLVHAAKLDSQVMFPGLVTGNDKLYLFQRANWFLLPSSQENFGNAVLEAIQNGCAVAISDQVYFKEFLHQEAEVLPVQTAAWTTFLRERLGDDARRRRLLELDREHVEPLFRSERVGSEWAAALRHVFCA